MQSGGIGDGEYRPVISTPPEPWFKGTGFTQTSVLRGLVGYEYDVITDGCKTPPLTHLFHFSGHNISNADSVRYTAPSGARVFSSGSIRFATALDPLSHRSDPRMQRFMRNAVDDLLRP